MGRRIFRGMVLTFFLKIIRCVTFLRPLTRSLLGCLRRLYHFAFGKFSIFSDLQFNLAPWGCWIWLNQRLISIHFAAVYYVHTFFSRLHDFVLQWVVITQYFRFIFLQFARGLDGLITLHFVKMARDRFTNSYLIQFSNNFYEAEAFRCALLLVDKKSWMSL